MRSLTLLLAGWLTGLPGRGTAAASPATAETDPYTLARQRMVAEQLAAPGRDITNARVLAAMGQVPRHEFVPERSARGRLQGPSAAHRPRADDLRSRTLWPS